MGKAAYRGRMCIVLGNLTEGGHFQTSAHICLYNFKAPHTNMKRGRRMDGNISGQETLLGSSVHPRKTKQTSKFLDQSTNY